MTRRTSHRIFPGIAALIVALLVAACGGSSGASNNNADTSSASNSATATIRYQDSPGIVSVMQLAKALGDIPTITLKDEGIVQGGPQALQALGTGQVDIAGAFTGATADVIANGSPVKAVISFFGDVPSAPTALIVKKGANLSKPKDWIGKKVAMNTLGAQDQAILDTWLQKGGLTAAQIKTVTLVPLPSLNEAAAVQQGQVDGAIVSSAVLSNALKAGQFSVVLKDTNLFPGENDDDQYVMADSWLKGHPAAAKAFIGGMAKAIVYAQTHSRRQVLAKVVPWLKANGLSEDANALATWQTTGISTKGGYITNSDFSRWVPWLKSQGMVKSTPSSSSLFTNQYNPYAPQS
jgi:ABC-type nitrate/sulfonate/bicarbonate transport system substrate-binding protein